MNESTERTVGQILREAREAQGMTLDAAAMRLRLMHRQIAAIEADDFDSLGQIVFARGFVRNYARLLGLAPDELLARMPGTPAEPAAVSQSEPQLPRSWLTSPWLILGMLGVLVGVAVPVALYLWLNSDVDEVPPAKSVVSVAPVAEVPAAVPAPAAPAPAAEIPQAPAAAESPAAGDAAPVAATTPAAHEPPAAGSVLHLEFGDESWTEIRDASGRMLHRQLNAAGSSVDVSGQPPFDVVIGNAPQARLTYNGRPIDLKPFTDATVARFTLEE